MKRILVVLGLVGALGTVFGTVPAGAGGPSNDLTLALSCDRGATAIVAVDFVANDGGDIWNFTCDMRRVTVPLPNPETAVIVRQFDVSTVDGGCASTEPQPLPLKIDCGERPGAKLTVR